MVHVNYKKMVRSRILLKSLKGLELVSSLLYWAKRMLQNFFKQRLKCKTPCISISSFRLFSFSSRFSSIQKQYFSLVASTFNSLILNPIFIHSSTMTFAPKIVNLIHLFLAFSWRRSLSCTNQSNNLLCKSMEWFLYDRDLRHESVNSCILDTHISLPRLQIY